MANRKHLVESAGYWFNAAREAQREGRMADALLSMENAYNHLENAFVALVNVAEPIGRRSEKLWEQINFRDGYKEVPSGELVDLQKELTKYQNSLNS